MSVSKYLMVTVGLEVNGSHDIDAVLSPCQVPCKG